MSQTYRLSKPPRLDDAFVEHVGACLRSITGRQSTLQLRPRVLVAFSGGPDSTALLAALKALSAASPGIELRACHVNHNLRGKHADEDERFCAALCKHWGIPLHIERLSGDIRDEAGLRDARYAVLLAHAQDTGARFVATGHTKSDQVETLLFRLLRGTSPSGLVGIPSVRRLSDTVEVVRPMLSLERPAVLQFLDRNGLDSRHDSSNDLIDYGRNYIRNRVIPQIVQRFPAFVRSMERLRLLIEEDEQLLAQLTHEAYVAVARSTDEWDRLTFLKEPKSIQRRLLTMALRNRGVEVTFERTSQLRQLAENAGGSLNLDDRWTVEVNSRHICFCFAEEEEERQVLDAGFEAELSLPGLAVVPRLGIALQIDALLQNQPAGGSLFPASDSDEALVDLRKAVLPLVVRVRRPGDTIQPFGMHQNVKLKKYLHTHKSDAAINPRREIVVADSREIIWVPGIGISDKVKVTGSPTHRLRFMHLAGDETATS